MRLSGKGTVEGMPVTLQRRPRIDVAGCAELGRNLLKRHVLGIQGRAAVIEMIHQLGADGSTCGAVSASFRGFTTFMPLGSWPSM